MCTDSCLEFVSDNLGADEVRGMRILEVGSRDVNGTVRPLITESAPSEYVGIDIEPGPGVDLECSAEDIVERFGPEAFDVVISTEMLEHVPDWRRVVSNMKRVVRPGGVIVVTTRSKGFHLHGYPYDFWRYELADMRVIFADWEIEQLEQDDGSPGVFLKARRPESFAELDLANYNLFSILRNRPASRVTPVEMAAMRGAVWAWTRVDDHLPRWAIERLKTTVRRRGAPRVG